MTLCIPGYGYLPHPMRAYQYRISECSNSSVEKGTDGVLSANPKTTAKTGFTGLSRLITISILPYPLSPPAL